MRSRSRRGKHDSLPRMSHSLGELKDFLREKAARGVALAYSGGVDSTLLLSVLKELCDEEGVPFVAIMARSVFQSSEEVRDAVATAESLASPLSCWSSTRSRFRSFAEIPPTGAIGASATFCRSWRREPGGTAPHCLSKARMRTTCGRTAQG